MGSPCPIKRWTNITWLALCLACAGCSQAVLLTHETENGGVVAYLYKEDRGGPMGSPHRREALKMIEKKCLTGYTVLKEGEVQGYESVSGTVEGTEDDTKRRRWGLKFRCKAS